MTPRPYRIQTQNHRGNFETERGNYATLDAAVRKASGFLCATRVVEVQPHPDAFGYREEHLRWESGYGDTP